MAKKTYKLRHIALSVPDVAAAQKFFEEAFGMTKAGNAQNGVHMTDGTMNVALLAKGGRRPVCHTNRSMASCTSACGWTISLKPKSKSKLQALPTSVAGHPTRPTATMK